MMRFGVPVGVLLLIAVVLDFWGSSTLGNILLGSSLTLGATFITEGWKRARERSDLAAALYFELANRVARCCIDFDAPWSELWERPQAINRFRLGKFLPEPMTIFNANANRISLFSVGVPATLMAFYFRFWSVGRDIGLARDQAAAASKEADVVDAESVDLIGRRFAATLAPGRNALTALAPLVPHAAVIEAAALETLDPRKLRFTGTLREALDEMIARADDIRSKKDGA